MKIDRETLTSDTKLFYSILICSVFELKFIEDVHTN